MNIFDFLCDEHEYIREGLQEIIYAAREMNNDRTMERSNRVFQVLRLHLKKEDELLFHHFESASSDIRREIELSRQTKDEMYELMDSAIFDWVDDPNQIYTHKIERLADWFNHHVKFMENTVYPDVRERLTQEEIDRIDKKVRNTTMEEQYIPWT